MEIRAINNQALEESQGSWDRVPDALTWSTQTALRRDAVIAKFARLGDWGFKDPRTLITLPLWLEAIENIRFVGTFRHPLAVARSLSQRDGFSTQRGLELWRDYNLRLLDYRARYEFPIVYFDWPREAYVRSVLGIADSLDLKKKRRDPMRMRFYDMRLHHQDGADPDEPVPAEMSDIHDRLLSYAELTLRQFS